MLHDLESQGRSLSMLGSVRLEQGKVNEARQALLDSLGPLEAAKDEQYLTRSRRTLAELSRIAGSDA